MEQQNREVVLMFGNRNLIGRKKRMMELAGRLKEAKEGTMGELDKIINRFASHVGIRETVAQSYLNMLIKSELIIIQHGEETWRYNCEPEREMFGVNI